MSKLHYLEVKRTAERTVQVTEYMTLRGLQGS